MCHLPAAYTFSPNHPPTEVQSSYFANYIFFHLRSDSFGNHFTIICEIIITTNLQFRQCREQENQIISQSCDGFKLENLIFFSSFEWIRCGNNIHIECVYTERCRTYHKLSYSIAFSVLWYIAAFLYCMLFHILDFTRKHICFNHRILIRRESKRSIHEVVKQF